MRTRYTEQEEKELQEINEKYDFYFTCTKYGTYVVVLVSLVLAIYFNL